MLHWPNETSAVSAIGDRVGASALIKLTQEARKDFEVNGVEKTVTVS